VTIDNGTVAGTDIAAGQLLALLRELTASPLLQYAQPPVRLTGGFWAELMAFSLADPPEGWSGEMVARLMPDPDVARKETIVQAAVAGAGFPTPAVRAAGGPAVGLGRAFMIMDKVAGRSLLSGLDGITALTHSTILFRRVPDSLAATMARLHSLDPEPVRSQLETAGDVGGSVGRMLEAQRAMATHYGRADLAEAAQWLADHRAVSAPDVICHGDLHPFNLLVDGGQVTVLDWSSALIGPRAHDVAFTSLLLAEPPLVVPGWLRPVVRFVGRRLARRFIRCYRRYSGGTASAAELRWHQALVCLRALVEVSGWAYEGNAHAHAGHPWFMLGPTFAARLTAATGVRVRAS
jgi:aminoglycoside phosphotransferase (APT) family kinase protein